jgi:hypothetical protein
VTDLPKLGWTLKQLQKASPVGYAFLPQARHAIFSTRLDEEVERWRLHVLKSSVQANAYIEWLIGMLRFKCLDYLTTNPLSMDHQCDRGARTIPRRRNS